MRSSSLCSFPRHSPSSISGCTPLTPLAASSGNKYITSNDAGVILCPGSVFDYSVMTSAPVSRGVFLANAYRGESARAAIRSATDLAGTEI